METKGTKDKFNEAEIRERKFINWFINTKEEHTDVDISNVGSYDRKDFTFYSGRTHITGEVKIRTFKHDKYDTVVLEMDKVHALMKLAKDDHINTSRTSKLFYFAVYPLDRTLLIIDIMNTPSTLSYEYCPITSMDESKGYTHKPMMNYNINENNIIKIEY